MRYSPESTRWAVMTMKACYTILRSPNGNRYMLYLYFNNDGSWNWNYNWLDNDRNANNPSAVLATIFISSPLCRLARWGSFVFQAGHSNRRDFYRSLRWVLKEKCIVRFEASRLPKESSKALLAYQLSG